MLLPQDLLREPTEFKTCFETVLAVGFEGLHRQFSATRYYSQCRGHALQHETRQ